MLREASAITSGWNGAPSVPETCGGHPCYPSNGVSPTATIPPSRRTVVREEFRRACQLRLLHHDCSIPCLVPPGHKEAPTWVKFTTRPGSSLLELFGHAKERSSQPAAKDVRGLRLQHPCGGEGCGPGGPGGPRMCSLIIVAEEEAAAADSNFSV
ncbi:hypothetical protein NDU88_006946 [Pleurodeles waltl]|uniref:Uncharacterized protein n=1 Tax=Pleurodeles waltl TaxID=8319 RepID=A0AAV7MHI7_PLEWA|nr:hypothetical protein NDU88_006946 [Pleurodeles waltl]